MDQAQRKKDQFYRVKAQADRLKGEVEKLRELVRHCWVHSGYRDCGSMQMDSEMRDLYCKVIERPESEREGLS